MSEKKALRNRLNRPSLVAVAVGCALAAVLVGAAAAETAELAPLRIEKTPGVSEDRRGRYSNRTLTVAVEIDRDGARLVAYTIKERPFLRTLHLPAVRTIGQDRDPQIEVVLLGPGGVQHTQRKPLRGLCLLHAPGVEPHIAGDTIRLHRDTILIEVPEVAGFDRLELAFHEDDPHAPARRSLGVKSLDAAHFTPAGGKVRYGSSAIASAEATSVGVEVALATSGQVHWPEEYGDPDIFRVEGSEAEMDRRLNVTVVPDGYSYADKAVMDAHFDAMVTHFRNKTPFKEHDPFVNYILVYAYSNESGTDQCDCDIIVDTAMATRFLESDPQCGHSDNRCLYYGGGCDTNSSGNIALAELRAPFPPAQFPDGRIVMVNTARYGGCGGYRAVYSAAHASGVEVAVHELGHSLGGLADEYTSNDTCGGGAGEVNTSLNDTIGAWPEWIADIGAPREGAQYYQQCVYRPESNCEMRSVNQPFCKVCRQHWSLVYFAHPNVAPTAPLESMDPASPTNAFTFEPTAFSVITRLAPGATNEFNWTIDGPGYAGPTSVGPNDPIYEHTFTQSGTYTLSCEIIADTNFIKPEKYGANVDTAIWEVNAIDSSVDHDGDGYAPDMGDCDDGNADTYPGALEINDGEDNQCFGEVGYGFADEIGPTLGFGNPADLTEFCWLAQPGATDYEVVRSDNADVSGTCVQAGTTATCWNDAEVPPLGGTYYYLVRALRPNLGSLGGNSDDVERADVCGTETSCDDGLDNDGDTFIDCDDPSCLGTEPCPSVAFQFVDTFADDIATTDVQTFFDQLGALPTDFIRMKLDTTTTILDWCSARADFYQDQYLALAATGGSADSGTWDRWSRIGAGAWIGPDTSVNTYRYGVACSAPYAWCLEPALSGFGILLLPDQTNQCETVEAGISCSDGTWELTIQVGVDRLAACGF